MNRAIPKFVKIKKNNEETKTRTIDKDVTFFNLQRTHGYGSWCNNNSYIKKVTAAAGPAYNVHIRKSSVLVKTNLEGLWSATDDKCL